MKKMMILALVMGMASLASAGIELVWDGSTLSIESDGASQSLPAYLTITGPGTFDISGAFNVVVPTDGIIPLGPVFGDDDIFLDMLIPANPIPNLPVGTVVGGIGIVFDSEVVVSLTHGDTLAPVAESITIPEPMTLGLLGLGGLFLRRRK